MSNASAGPRLTDEQQAALDAGRRSVSLSAGAGCGKTTVLTERFLGYIDPTDRLSGDDLSSLVAITFTDAAAREMRARVRGRAWQRFRQAAAPDEADAWQKLLRGLDSAQISTIHGFCSQLVRRHAIALGVDPQFETLEESAADLMRSQSVDDALRDRLEARAETVLELAAFFGLHNLRDYLVRLIADSPGPTLEKWQGASPDELLAAWQQHYEESFLPGLCQTLRADPCYEELKTIAHVEYAASDRLRDHLVMMSDLFDQFEAGGADPLLCQRLAELARVRGVCSAKDWGDAEQFARFRDTCSVVRKQIERLYKYATPCGDDAREAARLGLNLLDLVALVTETYQQRKRQQSALDFDDLLLYAHRLATEPAYVSIQKELHQSLRTLMVDEFQDTDPVQSNIVTALCGDQWREEGLFVVGDYKQSIYRFRGADPEVSIRLRQELAPPGRLSLTQNFRSQPAILAFVNALFHDSVEDDYEPLRPARDQTTPEPAIELLLTVDPEPSEPDKTDQPDRPKPKITADMRRSREATWIARRLRQMIDSGDQLVVDETKDGPQARPVEVGDIALLLRSLSDVPIYETALREEGLDYYLTGGHAFYSQQEIYDLLHLLRAVESRADELSLAGALRSPLFSLTDETLFWLVEEHKSLSAAMETEAMAADLPEIEAEKVCQARRVLRRLRNEKDRLLVAELLELAMAETGYDAVLLGEFLGPRKIANIRKLIEQARTLDRTAPGDLNGFITHLAEFTVRTPKESLAATKSEVAAIRIMTIHAAKGLEFPVVVLGDLNRKPPNFNSGPVFDEELGPLVPLKDTSEAVGYRFYQAAEDANEAKERTRLLYVGCTRAADYLILSASMKSIDKPESDWIRQLGERIDLETGALRGDLPDGYAAPQIRVTRTMPETTGANRQKKQRVRLGEQVAKVREELEANPSPREIDSPAAPLRPTSLGRRSYSFSRLSGEVVRPAPLPVESERQPGVDDEPPGRAPAVQLGQLVHGLLERIDFHRPEDIAPWCQRLSSQYLETPSPETEQQATRLVEQFLASDRGEALRTAQVVRREVEFLLPSQAATPTPRHWYGVIDCLYRDAEGAWHVLDYKTNRADAQQVPLIAAQYELQMFVYTEAATRALGVAPVESVLYFVRPGVEHRFQWTESARQRCINQLNAALEAEEMPED